MISDSATRGTALIMRSVWLKTAIQPALSCRDRSPARPSGCATSAIRRTRGGNRREHGRHPSGRQRRQRDRSRSGRGAWSSSPSCGTAVGADPQRRGGGAGVRPAKGFDQVARDPVRLDLKSVELGRRSRALANAADQRPVRSRALSKSSARPSRPAKLQREGSAIGETPNARKARPDHVEAGNPLRSHFARGHFRPQICPFGRV